MAANDPHGLERFVEAQRGVHERALEELKAGRKRSHWMWFVFPQVSGLGGSEMSIRYAIASLEEARAYLEHPVLGERLRECTQAVLGNEGRSIGAIFGQPDDMKFRSSMTLFAEAAPDETLFNQALTTFFGGEPDRLTLEILGR